MNEQSTTENSTTDPQTGLDKVFAFLRGLGVRRRTDDKWIGGVCSGIADRLGVDPVVVRAALVLLAILGGVGVSIYLVAWALLPNDKNQIAAERALRDGDGGSVVLLVFAALAVFGGSWWGTDSGWGFPWGLAFAGLFIWWLVRRSGNPSGANQQVTAQQPGAPYVFGQPPTGQPTTFGQPPTPGQPTMYLPSSGGAGGPSGTQHPVVLRRPRRRSGGPLMALLAIGLALVTYGSLNWLGDENGWTGSHAAIAMAGAVAAIGLLLIGLGIAGLRAGFVGFLAIVLSISAFTISVIPSGIHFGGGVGDKTWKPTSLTADVNYHLGVGDAVLDLRDMPAEVLNEVTIPAYVGLGQLKVLVPDDLTVEVVAHVGLGNIAGPGDRGDGDGGSDVGRTISVGAGPTEVVVDAGVGIGQLTVVKE